MKTTFISFLLLITITSYSQDYTTLKTIDSLVGIINYSTLKGNTDSTIQDLSSLGLYMKTYVTGIIENNQLRKYVNYVSTNRVENGITKKMISCNTFYYDQNKLIKVEECGVSENQVMQFVWYYWNQKCLYHSSQSEKAESRAALLLSMADAMVKTTIK